MSRFNLSECNERQRKLIERAIEPTMKQRAIVPLESDLHKSIEAELRRKRWFFCHSRMDKRTTTQLGMPDFIVAAPDGKTYWIEAKRKGNKLSKEQNITRHCLLALDHIHATVYSMEEFLKVITPL